MPPYERLLELLAASLRAAGFDVQVQGACLTVMGVDFWCRGLNRKTTVEFLHRQYKFTRYGVSPPADTAIADIVREVGERLEMRRRREARIAAARTAEEKRELARKMYLERCELLAKMTEGTSLKLEGEGLLRFSEKVTVLATTDGFVVSYSSEDFGPCGAAIDFLQELC